MYQWLYKETIETGIMVLLEDVPKYLKEGYVDTPDNYGKKDDSKKETVEDSIEDDLDAMTKADLEIYAKTMFGVDIDRRKNNKTIVSEIRALEAN